MTPLGRTASLVLIVALFSACGEGGIGDSAGRDGGEDIRAEYSRQIFFVAADATGAAVLDFTIVDAGRTIRRNARAWAEAGSGWTPLFDLSWEGAPVRRPWRIVPHGPIRLLVGSNDELEAIVVREDDSELAAIENGDFIAEWAPFSTAQIVLREGSLALGSEPIAGWLVDGRFGVTPHADDEEPPIAPGDRNPAGVAPAAQLAQEDSVILPAQPGDSLEEGEDEPVADYESGPSVPVHAVRGVLVGGGGETLVLADTETGIAGWLWTAETERSLPIVTMTPSTAGRGGWILEAGGGTTLSGTVEVMDEEPMPLSPRIVRGSITIEGDELAVHGVLRAPEVMD